MPMSATTNLPAFFTGCVDTICTMDKVASLNLLTPTSLTSSSPLPNSTDSERSIDSGYCSSAPTPPPSNYRVENDNSKRGVKRQLVMSPPPTEQGCPKQDTSTPSPKRQLCLKSPPPIIRSPLQPPPPPNILFDQEWGQVTQDMWDYFKKYSQKDEIFMKKMMLRDALYDVLQEIFPRCNLFVVGSSMNGLGTNSSDVDMCLMLSNQEIDQGKDATVILNYILKKLSTSKFVSNPTLIKAKVPILKFTDKVSGVEVDLNVNNMVGIRNTQLLNSYSRLDGRVKPLVLVVKSWARQHGINDAKNKTISSYSLVLMVIHFLQYGCDPPILPCLHELQPDLFRPNSDISQLVLMEQLPPFESTNNLSLGKILFGFLRYFALMFDYRNEAISVRLGRTIPKYHCINHLSPKNKRGMWKFLCIEEPFDRTNTARSVYDGDAFKRICYEFHSSFELLQRTRRLDTIMDFSA